MTKGYKVFNNDWTCRGFQYEVGKTYEENVTPKCCERGFHFCLKASDCFNYYSSDHNNKVAEVLALGELDYSTKDTKCATNKIQIVREIGWDEVQKIANLGKNCTGVCNTGNYNIGDNNTGNRNTGGCNTGDNNTGNRNTGGCNTGDCNTGDWNTGGCNTGDNNTGNRNTGGCNTGDRNTGGWNTGDRNTGGCNTGDNNTGNRNTGDRNTGDWNTGNRNTGDFNTGDWNTSSFNTGCFMTEEPTIMMFNKPTNWTYRKWLESDARYLLNRIDKNVVNWICESNMSDEEKAANPTYECTGGYLKVLNQSECGQRWWDGLSELNRNVIRKMPNFDAEIFEECTGIKI